MANWLTHGYPSMLWLTISALMIGLYVAGVVKLRRGGNAWPVHRTVLWLLGAFLLAFLTSGGPAVYGRMSFSAHMIQHMSLMVPLPLLLVAGAPVTLAMRALTARRDKSFGPREVLLALVHSRFLGIVGQPVVAAVIFTGSLIVFYYTSLFEVAMFTHIGHVLMTVHFLLDRLPVHLVAGRHRPGAEAAGVPDPVVDPVDHDGLPRLLRAVADAVRRADRPGLVARARPDR